MSASKTDAGKSSDTVQVAVRCRPMNPDEVEARHSIVVKVDGMRGTVTMTPTNGSHHTGNKERTFTFDTVFGFDSQQVDVYNETARPIVDSVLEGYNGTIFAYGQTGTGKTYTMQGEKELPEKRGIIPNSFAHVFGHIAKCQGETQFLVRVSYLELYNEEVRDLLSKTVDKRLEVRERTDIGVYVKDLSQFVVKTADEMDKLMINGNKNRHFAVTDMNEHSSRSHVIFTVTVERSDLGPDGQHHVRMGKLNLVDLAGSERQDKTHAEGQRLKEARKINLSLMMLGNVISSLVDGKSTHIPYRNSQLTRLLQDSLGGNSKTVMIANIGPASYNYDETLNTLRYANRAKNIQNKAHINEDPKDAMLREFQREIEELKQQLAEASGSEGESSGEEWDGEGEGGKRVRRRRHRKRHLGSAGLSPRAAAIVRAQLEKEKAAIMSVAEEERNRTRKELERREEELVRAQEQHEDMERKLQELSSKVIVGGVNLLEKAEEQERLLESSAQELEKRKKKEAKLQHQLRKKEAERVDMEERYASLQEEAQVKTRRLKEVWRQFQQAKEELANLQADFQQEHEAMLETVRQLSRDVRLQQFIIDSYIPDEYQQLLHSHAEWTEDIGEWHLRGIAHAGNNLKKQPTPEVEAEELGWDTNMAYLTYHVRGVEVHSMSSGGGARGGVRSSRPKAAHSTSGSKLKPSRQRSRSTDSGSQRSEEEGAPKTAVYPSSRGLISRPKHFA